MYLERLLPDDGLICVAMLLPTGSFRHFFHTNLDGAIRRISALDAQGHTVYLAQASFDPGKVWAAEEYNSSLPRYKDQLPPGVERKKKAKVRSQDNALSLKNFFLDIDCGEKWPLKNQKEGATALKQFLAETGLPVPAVVNSGNGLYAQWLLAEAIPAEQWRATAKVLKDVVQAYSPAIGGDSTRTADSASVLRPPGVTNRKPGREAKPVVLLRDMEPVHFQEFAELLRTAAKRKHITPTALSPPKSMDPNADFYAGLEASGPRPSARQIAERCLQVRSFEQVRGDVPEPLWYSMIGLLSFCEADDAAADELIQEWSSGHADYSPGQTSNKIQQYRDTGFGPTTCTKLVQENNEGCTGCPHSGSIKSPIVLGRPDPAPVAEDDGQCPCPERFRRADDGLYYDDDGRWVRFYDQDLYPYQLAYDESTGYEVVTIRHYLPHEGWLESEMRSALVTDGRAFTTWLWDNHIKVVGAQQKKYMGWYMESYMQKLQRQRRMQEMLCQMGWKTARSGSEVFVLGRNMFRADGTVDTVSLARNVPEAVRGFRSSGALDKWVGATRLLDQHGMEPYAFALLAGGFGAPLMKFTGYDGAFVSMVGDSGVGKTITLRWAQSVWGKHSELMMLRDDTRNALVSRLGVYGTLPLTIDELTNIDGMELSDLVYRITQGRDKARLTKNAVERKILNSWNTLALVSSNSSLIDKLSGAKHDASAEMNRIFEYVAPPHLGFQGQVTTDLYWILEENYGTVGEQYAGWMVQNTDTIKPGLERVRQLINANCEAKGEERYWSAVASVAIYGGLVAKKLGLIDFDVRRVMEWACKTIRGMRDDKLDLCTDAVGILAQFIDDHAANRLIVDPAPNPRMPCVIIHEPRGPLYLRQEASNFTMFISRAQFKTWLGRKHGSYRQVKDQLVEMQILRRVNAPKNLGAGTYFTSGRQVCWEIDLKSHYLGSVGLQLVEEGKALKEVKGL